MVKDTLIKHQTQALKNHEQETLTTLRYILAQIKNKEIEKRADLTDDEVLIVLRKIRKELLESIEAFQKGKREDLVLTYKKQLALVNLYLPKL